MKMFVSLIIMLLLVLASGGQRPGVPPAPSVHARSLQAPVVQAPIRFGTLTVSDPTNCSLYTDYRRWFLESQAWWQDPGVGYFDQRHIHLGTCFPHGETVSGTIPFDLVIKMHNNPAPLTHVRVQIFQTKKAGAPTCHGDGLVCYDFNPPLVCQAPYTDCTYYVHIDVPSQWIAYDGLQEFRFSAFATLGGKQMYQSTGWRAALSNGNPVQAYDTRWFVEGRGWHTDTEYTNARLDGSNPFPKTPVSGTWSFAVKLDRGTSGSAPATEHEVLLDPNIHNGSRGIVIRPQQAGPYSGSISIDTRQLGNGPHKLFLRTGAQVTTGTNSGVLVIPFTVQN
jgi:hypothetical protein